MASYRYWRITYDGLVAHDAKFYLAGNCTNEVVPVSKTPSGGSPASLTADFGSAQAIDSISMLYGASVDHTHTVSGSSDGVNFTDVRATVFGKTYTGTSPSGVSGVHIAYLQTVATQPAGSITGVPAYPIPGESHVLAATLSAGLYTGFSLGFEHETTYSWQIFDGSTWTTVPTTTKEYTRSLPTPPDHIGDQVRCLVTQRGLSTYLVLSVNPFGMRGSITNPATGVRNTAYTLTANPRGGDFTNYTYSWSGTDGLSGSTASISKSYATNGTKTIQCVVSSAGQSATLTSSIVIGDPPVVATISATPTTGQAGVQEFVFSISNVSGGTGSYTYAWSGDEGITGTGTSVSKTFTTTGTKNVQCIVTSGSSSVTKTISVTVTGAPITGSITVTPSPVVLGNAVVLTMNASGGNGTFTYSWSGDESLSGTTQSVNKPYTTIGTKTITCTVTSDGTTTPFSTTVVVESPPALVVSLVASAYTQLKDTDITFTPTVSGGTGSYTYTWAGTDGKTGSGSTAVFQWSTTGSKTVSVTVVSGTQNVTKEVTVSIVDVLTTALGRLCFVG